MADVFDVGNRLTKTRLNNPIGWTDVAHSAGNFIASGSMTWTVQSADQIRFRYAKLGKSGSSIIYAFDIYLELTSVGGTPAGTLAIILPFTAAETMRMPIWVADAGSGVLGFISILAASNQLQITLASGANWAAAMNTTYVSAQFLVKV